MGQAGRQRAEARAIFLSVCAALGDVRALDLTIQPLAIIQQLDTDFLPGEIDWMELDGNFIWTTREASSKQLVGGFPSTGESEIPVSSNQGPGLPALTPRHTLEIHSGSHWQLWLLDRREAGWKTRLLLQGP